MKKEEGLKEFVERVDSRKKKNPKDLSSDQDLTIAIMNLISIEEHLVFSGAKTGKTAFYDTVQDIREMRKNLMQKIIPSYEGEVWCISKHLLATSMRLIEVGTKQQSMGDTAQAYQLFDQAYDLYCLFWGLNMNLIDVNNISWEHDSMEGVQKAAESIKVIEKASTGSQTRVRGMSVKDKSSAATKKSTVSVSGESHASNASDNESSIAKSSSLSLADTDALENSSATSDASVFSKLKSFVRNAVDCCIE